MRIRVQVQRLAVAMTVVLCSATVAPLLAQQSDAEMKREIQRAVDQRIEAMRQDISREVERIVAERTAALRAENARLKRVIRELRGREGNVEVEEEHAGSDAPADGDRAFLGVSLQQAPADLARRVNADSALVVVHVLEKTPAARLGLAQGDLVVKINGQPATEEHFLGSVAERKPGDKMSVVFYQMGRGEPVRIEGHTSLASRASFQRAIEELMAQRAGDGGGDGEHEGSGRRPEGRVETRAQIGFTVEVSDGRATVVEVEGGSNADTARLEPGDQLLMLDTQKIASLDDVRAVVADWSIGRTVTIVSQRGDTTNTAVVRLGGGGAPARLVNMDSKTVRTQGGVANNRVTLGVTVEPNSDDQPIVVEVTPGSNAAVAGLQEGDRISRVDGSAIASIDALREMLSSWRPGATQRIAYVRDGRVTRVRIKVAAEGGQPRLLSSEQTNPRRDGGSGGRAYLGITPTASDNGVEIASLASGGPAASMGLQAGDVIKQINGVNISVTADLRRVLRSLSGGDEIRVVVDRNGKDVLVEGKLGSRGARGRNQSAQAEQGATSGSQAQAQGAVAKASANAHGGDARQQSAKPVEAEAKAEAEAGTLGVIAAEDGNRVVIDNVFRGSGAAAAGLAKGDVIVRCNGTDVSGFDALRAHLAGARVGDKLELLVRRGGEERQVTVELRAAGDETPVEAESNADESAAHEQARRPYVGFELEEHVGQGRVVVFGITGASPAAAAGFSTGDEILRFAGTEVEDLEAVRDTLGLHRVGDTLDVEVLRAGERVTIRLTLGAE